MAAVMRAISVRRISQCRMIGDFRWRQWIWQRTGFIDDLRWRRPLRCSRTSTGRKREHYFVPTGWLAASPLLMRLVRHIPVRLGYASCQRSNAARNLNLPKGAAVVALQERPRLG